MSIGYLDPATLIDDDDPELGRLSAIELDALDDSLEGLGATDPKVLRLRERIRNQRLRNKLKARFKGKIAQMQAATRQGQLDTLNEQLQQAMDDAQAATDAQYAAEDALAQEQADAADASQIDSYFGQPGGFFDNPMYLSTDADPYASVVVPPDDSSGFQYGESVYVQDESVAGLSGNFFKDFFKGPGGAAAVSAIPFVGPFAAAIMTAAQAKKAQQQQGLVPDQTNPIDTAPTPKPAKPFWNRQTVLMLAAIGAVVIASRGRR